MQYIERVCSSKSSIFPRRTVLVPIADALGIDSSKFKNRRELIKEIQRICPPSKRCENELDFITLCHIDEIPTERMFIWTQNKKTYGADIFSLKQYIDTGKTMNPWTIDYATGIDESIDRESYLHKYDMKNQTGLLEKIHDFFSTLEFSSENILPSLDDTNTFRFNIEACADEADQYATHLINCIESMDYRTYSWVLSDTLKCCLDYFAISNDFSIVSILEQLFVRNEVIKFNFIMGSVNQDNSTLQNLDDTLNLIKLLGRDTYYIGILKYFFIQLDETLKLHSFLSR